MKSHGCGEHRRTTENAQDEILRNSISPLGPNPEVCAENFPYIRQRKNHSWTSTKNFIFVALTTYQYQHALTTIITRRAMSAGGGDEEGMGGTRERGA